MRLAVSPAPVKRLGAGRSEVQILSPRLRLRAPNTARGNAVATEALVTESEQPKASPQTLADLPAHQVLVLFRHWIWAEHAKSWLMLATLRRRALGAEPSADLREEDTFAVYLWQALVWVVVEGFDARRIRIEGELRDALRGIRDPLRDSRNAVFHVGDQERLYDPRLGALSGTAGAGERVVVVHDLLGQTIAEELKRRGIDPLALYDT